MSDSFAKGIFVVSIAVLLSGFFFAYGLAVERFHIWPYQTVHSAWQAAKSLVRYGELVPQGRRVVPPQDASREAMTIHQPELISDGNYVFVGWDSNSGLYGAWLYDDQGERLHSWTFDYFALDPDGPLNGSDTPHGFSILKDGSIVVGFDHGDVAARLDDCSEPVWIKDGIYHHAISPTEDGGYWAWRGEGTPYGHYNHLEKFDAETGEVLAELELVEDIIRPLGAGSAIFGVRPDYAFEKLDRDPEDAAAYDLFHPNDVEELSTELAPLFPMFEAGDLLLSFRTINLVAVVGPDDGRMKWWSTGPWIGQHDPDFTTDGLISVYNNNTGRGRSEIVLIDPATRQITNRLFSGDASFYSAFMGKHQYLPNGNLLVTVPGEGRILEFTADGQLVMEFNNLSSNPAHFNEHVENGLWVPPDFFESFPDCDKTTP